MHKVKNLLIWTLVVICVIQAAIPVARLISDRKQYEEFQSRKECREKRFAYLQNKK